jgi:hypothetical protein
MSKSRNHHKYDSIDEEDIIDDMYRVKKHKKWYEDPEAINVQRSAKVFKDTEDTR